MVGYSFSDDENSFRLAKPIHNNDRIKMLRFAGQIYSPSYCRFPLANPQFEPHIVPESNPDNHLIILCICYTNIQLYSTVKTLLDKFVADLYPDF